MCYPLSSVKSRDKKRMLWTSLYNQILPPRWDGHIIWKLQFTKTDTKSDRKLNNSLLIKEIDFIKKSLLTEKSPISDTLTH